MFLIAVGYLASTLVLLVAMGVDLILSLVARRHRNGA